MKYRCTECDAIYPSITQAGACHWGIGGVVGVIEGEDNTDEDIIERGAIEAAFEVTVDARDWMVSFGPYTKDIISKLSFVNKVLIVGDFIVKMLADDPDAYDGDPADLFFAARDRAEHDPELAVIEATLTEALAQAQAEVEG